VLCEMLGADPGQILFGVPAIRQNSPIVDKALTSDPTTNGRYAMQEKRLKPRRIVKA
jgi:hypothetical protein